MAEVCVCTGHSKGEATACQPLHCYNMVRGDGRLLLGTWYLVYLVLSSDSSELCSLFFSPQTVDAITILPINSRLISSYLVNYFPI